METRKFLTIGTILAWLLISAFRFNIDILGYNIKYNPEPQTQIINQISEQPIQSSSTIPTEVEEFKPYIIKANHYKITQQILKELDYERIGFTDTDTGQVYTAFINPDGTIDKIYLGDLQPDVMLKGSVNTIKEHVKNEDIDSLSHDIEIPFKAKLKLFILRWF